MATGPPAVAFYGAVRLAERRADRARRPCLRKPRSEMRDRNFLRLWAATTIDSFGTWLLIATFVFWTGNGSLTALLVPFAVTRLHSAGDAVGYLIAGLGVGYLCGAAISKTVILRYAARTVLTVSYAVVGLCFLVAFTATTLPVALVAITVSGVPGAISQVAVRQTLQPGARRHWGVPPPL